jgi:hypothetical protein
LAVDTFRNDTSGYTPELKWSVLKVLLKVSTAKTGCHGSVSKILYYLRGSVLKVSTAQGIQLGQKSRYEIRDRFPHVGEVIIVNVDVSTRYHFDCRW